MEGVLAKLLKKKKEWEDKYCAVACRSRETVTGDGEVRNPKTLNCCRKSGNTQLWKFCGSKLAYTLTNVFHWRRDTCALSCFPAHFVLAIPPKP